jgi:metal iron transporter
MSRYGTLGSDPTPHLAREPVPDPDPEPDRWEDSNGHRDSFDPTDATPLIHSYSHDGSSNRNKKNLPTRLVHHLLTYAKFIGPGFLVAVAYIDPGNYATDVEAGADTRFALLFVVFMSNLIAILFQSLCIKLGSVTGRDLARNCREHLPRWLTILLYVFAEAAIIATDISEVS